MHRIIILLTFTLFIVWSAGASEYFGNAEFTSTYDSTGGQVSFPHGAHANAQDKNCNFCHSALRTFGGVTEMYGHKICKFCHENNDGPKECSACHDTEKIARSN